MTQSGPHLSSSLCEWTTSSSSVLVLRVWRLRRHCGRGSRHHHRAWAWGEPWRGRYDRLHLHTIRSLSHLPGYRIPPDFGRWVARDQFVQYLEMYAAHHRLEPRFGVDATRIDRDDGHWSVRTNAGTIPARVVVVATGYPSSTCAAMAWHIRWTGGSFGGVPQPAALSGSGRVDCWCGQQRHRDCRRSCRGRRGTGADRDTHAAEYSAARREGFPIQLLGIVFRRLPPRLLDQLVRVLRRATVPDLSGFGLPRPSTPFSQFRRTRTVPIFDVGFIDAVRSGVIEVVPGSPRSTAGQSCWPMDHACSRTPSWRLPAIALGSSRSSAISPRSESTEFQARNPVCISSECGSRSPGSARGRHGCSTARGNRGARTWRHEDPTPSPRAIAKRRLRPRYRTCAVRALRASVRCGDGRV